MKKNKQRNKIIKLLSIYFLLIIIFSCNSDKKQLILGEWEAIDVEELDAYIFQEDSICIYKPGFFTYFDDAAWTQAATLETYDFGYGSKLSIGNHFGCIESFLGSQTTYDIHDDTLLIFDLALLEQKKYEIKFTTPDTLHLFNNREEKVFVKKQHQQNQQDTFPIFDKVIVNLSFIYPHPAGRMTDRSFCSSNRVKKILSIDFESSMIYSSSSSKNGNWQSVGTIEPHNQRYLMSLYKQAGIDTVLNKNVPEREFPEWGLWAPVYPEIIFVKNNKMHTFRFPLHVFNNKAFFYTYAASMFSDQAFITLGFNNKEINLINYVSDFKQNENHLPLSALENFYLTILISTSPETKDSFIPKYSLTFYDNSLEMTNNEISMQTDGRYYRFKNKEDKWITLDIGFNFIENNNLEKQFKLFDEKEARRRLPVIAKDDL